MSADPITAAVTAGASKTISSLVEKVGAAIVSGGKGLSDRARIKFQMGFTHYIEQTRLRCSLVKTLIHRTEPVSIEAAYVPLDVQNEGRILNATDLPSIVSERKHITISGTAGSGKSMTLKYTYVRLCTINYGYLPIFVELRDVDFSSVDLIQFISTVLKPFTGVLDDGALKSGFSRGYFYVILDGLDEISRDQRGRAEKAILTFSSQFPSCPLLISSRPDSRLENWPSFSNYQMCPMTRELVVALINRINFAVDAKKAFCDRVNASLYDSHETLLSNPLLATMMFMTFDEYADVPSKMHIFYRQAFEVLYSKHDRFKTGFVRHYVSGVQFDSLERHIATFALMTLTDGRVSLDDDQLIQYLDKVTKYEGSPVKPQELAQDIIDNLCLLVRDEGRVTFIHRSFQEYFAAHFLSMRHVERFADFVDRLNNTSSREKVISFLYEMNPEVLEKAYITPRLDKLLSELKKNSRSLRRKALLLFSSLIVREHGISDTISVSYRMTPLEGYEPKWGAFTLSLHILYPEIALLNCGAMRVVKENLTAIRIQENKSSLELDCRTAPVDLMQKVALRELISEYEVRLRQLSSQLASRRSSRIDLLSDILFAKRGI